MDRSIKGLLWACTIILLLLLAAEAAGICLYLCQAKLLQAQVEQLNDSLDDIAALCASVSEAQQRLQEFFQGGIPLSRGRRKHDAVQL